MVFSVSSAYFLRLISIVETFLGLPPSLGVISSVPIEIAYTLASLKNRLRVISATSTAVKLRCLILEFVEFLYSVVSES
jgi:hypothetical protein